MLTSIAEITCAFVTIAFFQDGGAHFTFIYALHKYVYN